MSCGVRGQGRKATGRKTTKAKEIPMINIMHWNAEGDSNKRTELEHYLHENSVHICCIQETHLQEGKPFKIRGYQVFRSDRQGRKKGRVLTLVRNNMNAKETNRFMEEAEYIEVQIITKNSTLNIVNYYCPNDEVLSLDSIQLPNHWRLQQPVPELGI